MVAVHKLLAGDALGLCLQGDGGAMLVTARHHEHLVAFGPVVPREDVGGKVAARHVASVAGALSIRPVHAYENALRHILDRTKNARCILPQLSP